MIGGDGRQEKMEVVLDFVLRKDRTGAGKDALLKMFEDMFAKHACPTPSSSRTTSSQAAPAPPNQPLSNPVSAVHFPS
jgi:hypothetical protein